MKDYVIAFSDDGRGVQSEEMMEKAMKEAQKVEEKAELTVYDLEENYNIDSFTFVSKGKATPFDGEKVYGKCKMTMCAGKEVFNELV